MKSIFPNLTVKDRRALPEFIKENIPFNDVSLTPQQRIYLLREIYRPISGVVFGASAATAANYGTFFVSDRSYYVISVSENHRTAAGGGTISIEKCGTGIAEDSGKDLLTTPLSLTATANTPQFGTLTNTKADLILKKGDRLVLKDAALSGSPADVCVSVLLQEF